MRKAVLKVRLLAYTEKGEALVAKAAKLCYSNKEIDELDNITQREKIRLVTNCIKRGHHSVLEHAVMTFGIEGISRACSHQLVRHRLASYSQQSQRYVKYDDLEFVIPPDKENDYAYMDILQATEDAYDALVNIRGVKPEDARFVLPNSTATKIIVTMNVRELRHFFRLRCCNKAQWEIRRLANEMLTICKNTFPLLFWDAGPGCVVGSCPEGDSTCGKPWEKAEEPKGEFYE